MPPPTVRIAAAVASASPDLVVEAAARIGALPSTWPFLPAASSLLEGRALSFVESLFDRSPYVNLSIAEKEELAQYLALSTACHVLDGWRYISQAAFAFLSASRAQALHLAYYAELRAALAILAYSGIGILNKKHFALTGSGDVVWFQGATHVKAWEGIDTWSRQSSHGLEVVRCFSCLGLTGEEWATASGATSQAVGEYWVNHWSIDLHSLDKDKELRNEASYRPNFRANALASTSQDELRFVRDLSSGSIPVDVGQFDIVDRAVIYDLCRKSYNLLHDPPTKATLSKFWSDIVEWIVAHKGRSKGEADAIVSAIRTASQKPGGNLVRKADRKKQNVPAVFSRAFLLLRLSSALLRMQWEETRRRNPSQPWQGSLILDYVSHSLLCSRMAPTRDFTVLGADQEDAIDRVDVWMGKNTSFDPYGLWRSEADALVSICRFERVGALAAAL